MNRDEMMLNTILQNGELPDDFQPQSRFEAIAKSIINKEDYTEKPQSRHEELFLEIGEMIKEGGGGYPEPTGKITITENGTDINVKDYATADVDVSSSFAINDASYLFAEGARLDEYDKYMSSLSDSVTSTYRMFYYVDAFERPIDTRTFDLSKLKTSNVNNMEYMFGLCSKLESIDVSHFDTRKVITMSCMFNQCVSLLSLDLSNFDMSSTWDLSGLVNSCRSLESLIMGTDTTDYSKIYNTAAIFSGCTNLNTVTIRGINVLPITNSNAFTYLKSDCKFYVPANLVDSYKAATNWSTRANYIYPIGG